MSLVSQLQNLVTRVGTEFKSLRTLINGNAANLSGLTTTVKTDLVSAINEVRSTAVAAGTGDMRKSTYDADGDGKVDTAAAADTVPWNGVANKPSSYPPAAHDASLVTSGVFDPARIPVLPSQVQIVSTGDLTALTAGQQAQIGQGTIVTTTDGNRYVYSGSGSKTLAASYVVLADITPDWNTISSKPTTLTGYGITDAQAYSVNLTALAGLVGAADRLPYFNGAGSMVLTTLTGFARGLIAAADQAAGRTALGLGTAALNATGDFVPAAHAGAGGSAHAAVTTTVNGFMLASDKSKLDGVAANANNYSHPTGDGNLHVPATGTTNGGRFLKAGSTAGSISWTAIVWSDIGSKPTTIAGYAITDAYTKGEVDTAVGAKANSSDVGDTTADFVATFNAALA